MTRRSEILLMMNALTALIPIRTRRMGVKALIFSLRRRRNGRRSFFFRCPLAEMSFRQTRKTTYNNRTEKKVNKVSLTFRNGPALLQRFLWKINLEVSKSPRRVERQRGVFEKKLRKLNFEFVGVYVFLESRRNDCVHFVVGHVSSLEMVSNS